MGRCDIGPYMIRTVSSQDNGTYRTAYTYVSFFLSQVKRNVLNMYICHAVLKIRGWNHVIVPFK